jgi:DNA repair protein RadC
VIAQRLFCEVLRQDLSEPPVLGRVDTVVEYLRVRCGHAPTEWVCVLYLDSKHHLLHEMMRRGTLDSASMDPREIMTRALEVGAAALILAHNHPSGLAEPSMADRQSTRRVRDAGHTLGIAVLDHLIVTCSSHFSFREANML